MKLDTLRAWLEERELSAALLGSQANFAWITAGGHSHVSVGEAGGVASILVTLENAYLVTTNIELHRILDEELVRLPFDAVDYAWHRPDQQGAIVARLCDTGHAICDLERDDMAQAAGELAKLRYVMLPPEVDRYRALGKDAAEAVEIACRSAESGDSELDVAGRVAYECTRRNILPLVNLVAADERIARYRHPIPSGNQLRGTLFVALTGRRHGLHASLTRMVSVGLPDSELLARHDAVTRLDARVLLASAPGVSLGEAMATLIDQYAREGFPGEWQLHHQGGLTGYAGREIFATSASSHRLTPNQAVAWNPSITRVKSEDTVLVRESGFEVLTRTGAWPETNATLAVGSVKRPSLLAR